MAIPQSERESQDKNPEGLQKSLNYLWEIVEEHSLGPFKFDLKWADKAAIIASHTYLDSKGRFIYHPGMLKEDYTFYIFIVSKGLSGDDTKNLLFYNRRQQGEPVTICAFGKNVASDTISSTGLLQLHTPFNTSIGVTRTDPTLDIVTKLPVYYFTNIIEKEAFFETLVLRIRRARKMQGLE